MKKTFALVFGFLLIIPSFIFADGMVMPNPIGYVKETGQNAAIFFNNNKEDLILSVSYEGDSKDFAWLVPTPNKPTLNKVSQDFFTKLEEETTPKDKLYEQVSDFLTPVYYGRSYGDNISTGVSSAPSSKLSVPETTTVKVVDKKKVGPYDTTVLTAKKADDLNKWLKDNKYKVFDTDNKIITEYLDNNWYFVAMKISNDYQTSKITSELKSQTIAPIALSFNTDKIIFPLKISSLNQNDKSTNSDYKSYLEDQFYYDLSGDYTDSYMKRSKISAFNNSYFDSLVALESGGTSELDLRTKISQTIGTVSLTELSKAKSLVEYYPDYYDDNSNDQSITLYTFGSKKMQTDNYSTTVEYASNISKGTINSFLGSSSFAVDKGYFMTKLSSYAMSTEDMNADMLFAEAKDNKGENDGSMDLPEWLFSILFIVGAIIYFPISLAIKFGGLIGLGLVGLFYLVAFIGVTVKLFLDPEKNKRLISIAQTYILLPLIGFLSVYVYGNIIYNSTSSSDGDSFWVAILIIFIAVLVSYLLSLLIHLIAKKFGSKRQLTQETERLLKENPQLVEQLRASVAQISQEENKKE